MADHPTRRDLMMVGAALTVVGGLSNAHGTASAEGTTTKSPNERTATGRVIDSATGAPIPDVLVSNGREVVRSDANGRFGLPVAPGQTIFVIKPAGYRVPVDARTNLPHFSYVHDPDGTPIELDYRYGGLPESGPLPPSIDFQLAKSAEDEKFDVLLLTDPQPESTTEIEFIRDDVVSPLIGTNAAFGITCGDIAFDDLSMYGRINRIIGRIGIPWWVVGGNHDLDYEAPDALRSRDTFKRVYGAPYYALAHGKALFIMLDNVEYFGASHRKSEDVPSYRGVFSADQLAFVANVLSETPKDRLIVLIMHIPLRTYLGSDPARNTTNAADLLKLLGDRPAVSFAGHTHSTEHHYLGAAEGVQSGTTHHHHVLTAVSGAWWSGPLDHRGIAAADSYDGTPNGHHVLSIDGATYTTRFIAAAEPAGKQMRISIETQYHQADRNVLSEVSIGELLRSPISAEQARSARVLVNLFDGGPKTRVSFTLDDGAPVPMKQVSRPDPFIVQVFGRHPETLKKWVTPQNCSHLWQASLPGDIEPGSYALRVSATDEYGRTHRDGMVLEVV